VDRDPYSWAERQEGARKGIVVGSTILGEKEVAGGRPELKEEEERRIEEGKVFLLKSLYFVEWRERRT